MHVLLHKLSVLARVWLASEGLRMNDGVNGVQATLAHAAAWRKSSYSNPSGNCVEAAELAGGVALRDSRSPDGPALVCTSATWDAFIRGVKDKDLG
jgi:hypothetical protein